MNDTVEFGHGTFNVAPIPTILAHGSLAWSEFGLGREAFESKMRR